MAATSKSKGKIIRSGYVPSQLHNGYPQQASTQPIVEVNGILRFGLPGEPRFPALSADSILKPTLSWLLQTERSGQVRRGTFLRQRRHDLAVGLQPRGARRPGSKTDLLDMVGWITMRNQSGKTFENARIKLMAGDVNKIQEPTLGGRVYAAKAMAVNEDAMAPAGPGEVIRRIPSLHAAAADHPARSRKPSRWSS